MLKTWFRPKAPTQFYRELGEFKKEYKSQIHALQRLAKGEADEHQQKRALSFIINYLCQANEVNYFQDSRDHAFMSGREAVGKILLGLCTDHNYLESDNG